MKANRNRSTTRVRRAHTAVVPGYVDGVNVDAISTLNRGRALTTPYGRTFHVRVPRR